MTENEKATTNPKNTDNNCFQYALIDELNYQSIESHPERVSIVKPCIDQYNWKEIDFPTHPQKDWKMFELNDKSIALNVLYVPHNAEEIMRVCVSKHIIKRECKVPLL